MRKEIILLAAGVLLFTGCQSSDNNSKNENQNQNQSQNEVGSEQTEPVSKDFFAMDTYMNITAYGSDTNKVEQAVELAENKVNELDNLLSTGIETSEINRLNENGHGEMSDTSMYLLEESLKISSKTDGAFNPVMYPLMELWGFTSQNYHVASDDEIAALLPLVNVEDIKYDTDKNTIKFNKEGMKIDFGGIAKGYTSDEVVKILKDNGIKSAFISLGGNVWVLGNKTDGSKWRVGIQNPDNTKEGYLGILSVCDTAVITSGGYERYFEEDGKVYHHILDPNTGKPADSGIKSVTIISRNGTLADGLSTALFVCGLEKASQIYCDSDNEFEAILLTQDDKMYVTEGITDSLETDYDYEIIHK